MYVVCVFWGTYILKSDISAVLRVLQQVFVSRLAIQKGKCSDGLGDEGIRTDQVC